MTTQPAQPNNSSQKLYAPLSLNAYQQHLLTEVKASVAKERESTLAVVKLLRKIEVEKIYAILGYSSLWEFTVKELGYSPDSAFRRISAMRLIRELPQAKEKMEKGTLTLTAAAQLQKFIRTQKQVQKQHFNRDSIQGGQSEFAVSPRSDQNVIPNSARPMTYANQVDLLNKVEGKSTREVERILLAESEIRNPGVLSAIKIKCQEKPINTEWTDVTITLDNVTLHKLKEIKDAVSNALIITEQREVNLATAIKKIIHDTHEKIYETPKLKKKALTKNSLTKNPAEQSTIAPFAPFTPLASLSTSQQEKCQTETPLFVPVSGPVQIPIGTPTAVEQISSQISSQCSSRAETNTAKYKYQDKYNAKCNARPHAHAPLHSLHTPMTNSENPVSVCAPPLGSQKVNKRQTINSSIKKMIFQKYQAQCQYAGCRSQAFLQIDHKIPLSAGGNNAPENLTLLCATHNRLKGQKKWIKCV